MDPLTTRMSGVAIHPEDDQILAAAVNGQAEYLVAGDKKLQSLGIYQGVRMISPRTFLDLLEATGGNEP